jgi:hypothetical protein
MNGCVTDAMIEVITEMVPSRASVEKAEVANARSSGYRQCDAKAVSDSCLAARFTTRLHV